MEVIIPLTHPINLHKTQLAAYGGSDILYPTQKFSFRLFKSRNFFFKEHFHVSESLNKICLCLHKIFKNIEYIS